MAKEIILLTPQNYSSTEVRMERTGDNAELVKLRVA